MLGHDDLGHVRGNAFFLVAPLAGQLQGGFHGFGPGIHHQGLVVAEQFAELLLSGPQLVIKKCPRRKRELLRLLGERPDDVRVAVSLVHGRVGREKVEIMLAVYVPEVHALAPIQHHGQGVVVVGTVLVFELHQLFGAAGGGGRGGGLHDWAG